MNRLALTEIKNIEHRTVVFQRGHRPLNDVVDVSVIAAGGAVAKLVDRFAGMNFSRELMDREVGPLPRAVNGEVAERHHPHFVEMRIGRAEKLARDFCRCVRTQRLHEMFFF